MAFFAREGG